MKRFIEGVERTQSTLFPDRLEDWIGDDNPVRAIDVFVDELELGDLGFGRIEPQATGRPAYPPCVLLKLYIYGYLNRVQSSRRLELAAVDRHAGLGEQVKLAAQGDEASADVADRRTVVLAPLSLRKSAIVL